jgi:hypothetical protein
MATTLLQLVQKMHLLGLTIDISGRAVVFRQVPSQ